MGDVFSFMADSVFFVAGLGEAGNGNNSPGPTGAGYNESGKRRNPARRAGWIEKVDSPRVSAPGYNRSKIRLFSCFSRVSWLNRLFRPTAPGSRHRRAGNLPGLQSIDHPPRSLSHYGSTWTPTLTHA